MNIEYLHHHITVQRLKKMLTVPRVNTPFHLRQTRSTVWGKMTKLLAPSMLNGELTMYACVSAYASTFRALVSLEYFTVLQNY